MSVSLAPATAHATAAWSELLDHIHPADVTVAPGWRQYYEAKFDLARVRQPKWICEIGVRAGYSAFMFLRACPDAFLLGIDNDSDSHGGVPGLFDHARTLLSGLNFALLLYDS